MEDVSFRTVQLRDFVVVLEIAHADNARVCFLCLGGNVFELCATIHKSHDVFDDRGICHLLVLTLILHASHPRGKNHNAAADTGRPTHVQCTVDETCNNQEHFVVVDLSTGFL